MKLEPGVRALVTGASRGLGVEIASKLAGKGVDLALAARSVEALGRIASDLRSATGVQVSVYRCDLAEPGAETVLQAEIEASGEAIDILVNNAGVEQARAYTDRQPVEILRDIRINLAAPMLLAHAMLPSMIARGRGHILNIASVSGLVATPFQEPYSATKFGLVGFSRSLRLTSAAQKWGVGVSALCPGFVAGDGMFARIAGEHDLDTDALGAVPLASVGTAALEAIEEDREIIVIDEGGTPEAAAMAILQPEEFFDAMLASPVTTLFAQLSRTD